MHINLMKINQRQEVEAKLKFVFSKTNRHLNIKGQITLTLEASRKIKKEPCKLEAPFVCLQGLIKNNLVH